MLKVQLNSCEISLMTLSGSALTCTGCVTLRRGSRPVPALAAFPNSHSAILQGCDGNAQLSSLPVCALFIQMLGQALFLWLCSSKIKQGLCGRCSWGTADLFQVWQYITLMRRIFLIDCPGVVYPSGDSETDIVLKGVVRACFSCHCDGLRGLILF